MGTVMGFRPSSIRRICEHCRTQFRPKRSDAKFCCNLCRQASAHKRKEVAFVADAAAVFQKKRTDALEVINQFDSYQSIAGMLHQTARTRGLNLSFMATRIGVVVVKDDSLPADAFPPWFKEIKTRSDDPELQALLSIPSPLGSSFIAREAEDACRGVLRRGPTDLSLFVDDWDHYLATQKPIPYSPWVGHDRDDDRDFDYAGRYSDDVFDIGTDSSGSLGALFPESSD